MVRMVTDYDLHTHLTTLFAHGCFVATCAAVSAGVDDSILFVFLLQRECLVKYFQL